MLNQFDNKRADICNHVDDVGAEHDIGGLYLRFFPPAGHQRDALDTGLQREAVEPWSCTSRDLSKNLCKLYLIKYHVIYTV